MKNITIYLTCLLISCSSLGFGQDSKGQGPYSQLIIRGVTLINGNGAPPQGPIDIVVENNVITQVEVVGYPGVPLDDSKRPKLKAGGKELNCEGMYLLPGFIDMHGHIGGTAQGADYDYVFKLWMAHGITTVREPSGRGVDWTMDLKRKSAKNEIIAPRIFAYTGFGQGSTEPISTPEMAREWVQCQKRCGWG
jgi:predicted amidohydrolase